MAVELLLVLLLEAENDLHRTRSHGHLTGITDNDIGRILHDVCSDILAPDGVLGDTILVTAHLFMHRSVQSIRFVHMYTKSPHQAEDV
jgi:hypothetical protein